MACTCENNSCTQETIEGIVYCNCLDIIENVQYPIGCTLNMLPDGNATYTCIQQVAPTIVKNRTPIYFDNSTYFEDVSFTIAFKPTDGSWVSYYSFYPDYSVGSNNFFQIGYNWGKHKETVWNHLMDKNSFCVFQGEKHTPHIEMVVANENVNKILNSISLNIEGIHYSNEWDSVVDKNISFKNMYIYNRTDNSGMLGLNPQKTLQDNRKYPQTVGNTQEILFTSDEGSQNVNYFFNRVISDRNNVPTFNIDKNNIFKTINTNAVKFTGKKVLERMKGDWFMIHLEGMMDSRYGLLFKNSINDTTIYE